MAEENSPTSVELSSSQTLDDSGISNQSINNENNVPPSSISLKDQYISEIVNIVKLADPFESKVVAKVLMIKGRQALIGYKDALQPEIFEKQISNLIFNRVIISIYERKIYLE